MNFDWTWNTTITAIITFVGCMVVFLKGRWDREKAMRLDQQKATKKIRETLFPHEIAKIEHAELSEDFIRWALEVGDLGHPTGCMDCLKISDPKAYAEREFAAKLRDAKPGAMVYYPASVTPIAKRGMLWGTKIEEKINLQKISVDEARAQGYLTPSQIMSYVEEQQARVDFEEKRRQYHENLKYLGLTKHNSCNNCEETVTLMADNREIRTYEACQKHLEIELTRFDRR